MNDKPLLEVKNLSKHFPLYGGIFGKEVGRLYAVVDVSFDITRGEAVGLVGESGCGKSTLGRTILRLYEPTNGEVLFLGESIFNLKKSDLQRKRREMQMIFQDPYASLNPRMTILNIVGEPLVIHKMTTKKDKERRVKELLDLVGMKSDALSKYPHEFSGGQRQRIGIARSIALNPKFIVCDEPVSALDVSIRAQVINLLMDLGEKFNLTYLFISHDLNVVRHISNRIIIMYLGNIVEVAMCDDIFSHPLHPYTQSLLSAIPATNPRIKKKRMILAGDVPSPINPPSGCPFHPRCFKVMNRCKIEKPSLDCIDGEHKVACFNPG